MAYDATGTVKISEAEKERIVTEFLPRIKSWVLRIKQTLPDSVDVDDLYSAASLGLIEAMERFDKSRNVHFYAFAERRIKGAILDCLRGMDFLPRNVRSSLKQLESAMAEIASRLGRQPTHAEVAEMSQFSEEEIHRLLGLQESEHLLSLDEAVGEEEGSSLIDFVKSAALTPEDEVLKARVTERLADEIDKLSEKERLVVSLYYYEELTMKEIAEILGITESRVSQIHSATVGKMKKRLRDIHE